MKPVKNWRGIAARSHSMWSMYLGTLLLIVPEGAYLALGYQIVSPYLSGYGAAVFLVYGMIGRLWDQGLSDD